MSNVTAPKPDNKQAADERRPGSTAPDFADARDRALIRAHLAGDPKALTELLTGYQDRLFGVCLRMIGEPEEARDLTQEAFVRVIQGLHQFQGQSKVSTWMIRVAMNVCLTYLRRKRLRRTVSLDAVGSREDRLGSDNRSVQSVASPVRAPGIHSLAAQSRTELVEPSTDERVQMAEERRRLYLAIEQLDPEQRAMLILRDMQGMDYRHIAEVLDIPEGTVKSRLFRARASLRERMESLGGR